MLKILKFLIWFEVIRAQFMIDQPIPPKITWSNIGIDPPTIYLYFSSKLETQGEIKNIWLEVSIPFYTLSLNSKWDYVNNCNYDYTSLKNTNEERYSGSSIYSNFYINLLESTFIKDQVYVLILKPDFYIDYVGFSEPIKISIISGNYDNHIVFAYNNSFINLISSNKPSYNTLIIDDTDSLNKNIRNTNFDSKLIWQFPKTNARKIIINVFSDYNFGDDAEIKCSLMENKRLNIPLIPKEDYNCRFTQELGDEKNKYLLFEFTKYDIPEGKYLAYFTLQSPQFGGKHDLKVFLMDLHGNFIYSLNTLKDIFKTKPSTWGIGYPYIKFSLNFRADDDNLPKGIGLYSTTTGDNQVFNHVVFIFKATENIPRLVQGESYELQIQLGANNLIVPLGYIHDNLDLANGLKKEIQFQNDRIVIKNILIFNGKEYKISFKLGIIEKWTLSLSEDKGFGYVNLLYKGKIFFKSQAKFKKGFNNIIDNMSIRIPEDTFPVTDLYFRSFSSFSSGDSNFLGTNATNYQIKPNQNGLKFGNNQYFYFQSSIGNNIKYFNLNIDYNLLDSSKSFVEVITDSSINSKITNFDDSFANNNCQIYIQRVSKWTTQLILSDIVTFYDPISTDSDTVDSFSGNNLINGCSYQSITGKYEYSKFRMRLKDQTYRFGGTAVDRKLSGMRMVTFPTSDINTSHGRKGNYFVWKDIDISFRPTEINLGERDNTILDAFLNFYYFTNTLNTQGDIKSSPTITMWENLYILDNLTDSNFKMSDLKISMQNIFLQDTNASATQYNYVSSDYAEFPYFMAMHGSISTVFPTNTFALKIFFDFIEPITYDDENIDCSAKGVTIISCKLVKGINNLKKNTYRKTDNIGINKYSYNPRYGNSILINMNFSEILTTTNFSIVFPFKVKISNLMNELIHLTGMSNTLKSLMSYQLFDNSYRQIAYYDYSRTNETFNLWIIHSTLINTANGSSITSLKKSNTDVSRYDDSTVNNNVSNGVWVNNNNGKSGSVQNINMKSNCDNCNDILANNIIFGTISLCANYNFYNDTNFSINNSSTNNRDKCHTIKYLNNSLRYCLFCPKIITTTPNTNDSSAQDFLIMNFLLPNSNGLKYPSSMVGVISQNYVKSYNSLENLNVVMKPNLAIIKLKRIAIPQNNFSWVINLNFEITNPLKVNQVLLLRRISGENILSIFGLDQKPPCFIFHNFIEYKCEYYIVNTGIYIVLLDNIPSGQIFLKIYGISSGSTSLSSSIKFKFETIISSDISDVNKVIDSSEVSDSLEFIYTTSNSIGSGNLSINKFQYKSKFYNSYTDLEITIQLIGRNILLTDELNINFGIGGYNATDDPIWCLLKDPFTKKILEKPAICIKDNLDQLIIKFKADLDLKEFILIIYNFKLPIQSSPGIKLSYTFNNGFKAFDSILYNYTNLINRNSFSIPITGDYLLKGRGFKNVYKISMTPDFTIEKKDVLFIKFSKEFSPNLSKYPIYAFETKSGRQLKLWRDSERTVVVTGWNTSLDGGLAYEFEIRGVESPGGLKKRYIQLMVFKENPINDFVQWGILKFDQEFPSVNIKFLYQNSLIFTNRTIRANSSFILEFSYDKELSYHQIINWFFDNLEQELVKNFNAICNIYLKNDINKNNISSSCKILGNNIKIILKNSVKANEKIIISIKDFPNPDFSSCSYLTPQLLISNAIESHILISSSILLNNINKSPFKNLDNTINLDYKLNDGTVEIPRGFYNSFKIIIDKKHQNRFFQEKLYFSLGNNLNGLIKLNTVKYLDFDNYLSSIGKSEKNYVLGVNLNAVLTTYFIIINKRETFILNKYSNLPLLKLKIIDKKSNFISKNTIIIYRGGISLPIYIEPELVPVDELYFLIEFNKINGVKEEELTIRNNKNAIKLSSSKPIEIIQIQARISTIKDNTKLIIKEQGNNPRFNTFEFNILIRDKKINFEEKIIINFREISLYTINIDFASNTSTYIIYYLAPKSEFVKINKNIIENWIKNGIKNVGEIKIGYSLINDFIKPETKFIKNLWSQTTYKLRVFYETPETNKKKTIDSEFTTKSINLKDGEFQINFKQPVFLGYKQTLLCLLSIKYSIPTANLWTDNGINCENDEMDTYVLNDINLIEKDINKTIAEINNSKKNSTSSVDNSQNSANLQKIYKPTLSMKVLYFASKKFNEPKNIFERLFNDTRKKETNLNFGKIFNNQKLVLNITSFFQTFYNFKPKIDSSNLSKTLGSTSINISSLKTNTTGFFLSVIDESNKFNILNIGTLKRVNSFLDYRFLSLKRNQDVNFSFNNLKPNTKYSIFCISVNNDPRKNAITSDILNITDTTLVGNVSISVKIIRLFWIYIFLNK